MDERRRFSRREKNAMYAAWHGRCADCGAALGDGWHADHSVPWVRGGRTDMNNGRPLCPTCNLRKGSSVQFRDAFDPGVRPFQGQLVEAVTNRYAAREKVTVGLIWCGSGKTIGYQAAVTELMRLESRSLPQIKYVLIYVPRLTLARQAEMGYRTYLYDDAGRKIIDRTTGKPAELGSFSLFDPTCRLERVYHRGNQQPILPPGETRIGLVSTYQSLVSDLGKDERDGGQLHIKWARKHAGEFLLVADEAQYCGAEDDEEDDGAPAAGRCIAQMAEYAGHVLLLTGTAERADGRKLVLCDERYEEGPRGRLFLRPDVTASYSDGITFNYLRQFDAAILDAGVRLKSGVEYDLSMASAQPPGERAALADVLRDPALWTALVDLTVKRLRTAKRVKKDHRALIACMGMQDVKDVVDYLKRQYPELRVAKAVSKDGPAALTALEDFKQNSYDVLVSVRMAFLGYDCPEITVVGVLTNYRDLGHLTQLVFRGGRIWKDGGPAASQRLHLIVPDDEAMQRFIVYLRNEQARGLSQRDDGGGEPPEGTAAEMADAWATDVRGATNEEDIEADEFAQWEADLDEFGPLVTPADFRAYWEAKGARSAQPEPAPEGGELPLGLPARAPSAGPRMTDGQAATRRRSEASGKIGAFLRTHGWSPDHPRYRKMRQRLTFEINDAFGIDGTDQLSTSAEAEKYLAHVKSYLARLNEEGWQ